MIRLKPIRKNKWSDPVMTVEVTGWYDIYRFSRHLQNGQVEFSEIGTRAIQRTHSALGAKVFWHMMRHFHGNGRMEGSVSSEQMDDIRARSGYWPKSKHRRY